MELIFSPLIIICANILWSCFSFYFALLFITKWVKWDSDCDCLPFYQLRCSGNADHCKLFTWKKYCKQCCFPSYRYCSAASDSPAQQSSGMSHIVRMRISSHSSVMAYWDGSYDIYRVHREQTARNERIENSIVSGELTIGVPIITSTTKYSCKYGLLDLNPQDSSDISKCICSKILWIE